MKEFVVTVGVQYGRETHPTLPGITGDHYVRIEARDEEEARRLACAVLDNRWAFIYPLEEFDVQRWAPAGVFASITLHIVGQEAREPELVGGNERELECSCDQMAHPCEIHDCTGGVDVVRGADGQEVVA